jgi:hypothetical protein
VQVIPPAAGGAPPNCDHPARDLVAARQARRTSTAH